MSGGQHRAPHVGLNGARCGKLTRLVAIPLVFVITSSVAWAYWSAVSTPGGNGASAATSVNPSTAPSATSTGSVVTVTWAATKLSSGQAVTGYQVKRYANGGAAQTILSACASVPITALTCTESAVPAGSWQYSITPVVGDNWRGVESAKSAIVVVDVTAPANAISLSGVTGGAFKSVNTIFYRGAAAGSLTLTNAVTDPGGSGPASIQTAALTPTLTGWTHTPSTVSTPAGGPYVSSPFAWTAGTTSAPGEIVTGRDAVGNTTTTNLSFVNDSSPPIFGSVDYTGADPNGRSITITFAAGSDNGGSGVSAALGRIKRSVAPLVDGTCGTYVTNAVFALGPTSPFVDNSVSKGHCYTYQYVLTDNVGNTQFYSGGVAKVDYSAAVNATTGLLSQWRFGEAPLSTTAVDSKGSNTGNYVNGVQLGVTGAIIGDANTAASFDGTNDYMKSQTTTGFPVGAAPRSVEVWFNTPGPASGQGRQALFSYGNNADTQEFGVWLEPDGTHIKSDGGGSSDRVLSWTANSANFNDGKWHHFVSTYDGTSTKMYLDGVLGSGTNTATRNTPANPTYGFAVGAILDPARTNLNTSSYFKGSLDEMSFYSTALDQATITNHYQLGTSPAADFSAPTGGSVAASGLAGAGAQYSTTTTLNLNLVAGTDPSGMALSGAQLLRATATLTSTGGDNGVCGTFGTFAQVGADDPVSPKSDTVADQACYRYQYVVADAAGNSATYTSSDIKVDLTAPSTPSLTFSAFTNTYWSGSGSIVFYRSAAANGAITVTASSTDAQSGIAKYVFPTGGGWTSTPGAPGVNTYSWSGAGAPAGTTVVTAQNNADLSSAPANITLTADNTAPTAGTLTYADSTTTSTSVSLTLVTGTDGGSGVGTRLLQRASATLTGTTCGTFGGFATVTGGTNPPPSVVDAVSAGNCHKYQYVTSDNVGNQGTPATSASIVKVSLTYLATINNTPGLLDYYRLGESGATTVVTDSKSANNGTYFNTPTLGATGAIVGDSNTAATFDGVNDYASIPRSIKDNFSIEFWFKSTQGLGKGLQWYQGAGMVDAEVNGAQLDFGVSLRSDGNVVAGVGTGSGDISIVSTNAGYNLGTWHHVVFTRSTASTGTIQLFVDGAFAGSATGGTASLTNPPTINFGRIQNDSNYFLGSIDEVALYDVALSATTATEHYNAGK